MLGLGHETDSGEIENTLVEEISDLNLSMSTMFHGL